MHSWTVKTFKMVFSTHRLGLGMKISNLVLRKLDFMSNYLSCYS